MFVNTVQLMKEGNFFLHQTVLIKEVALVEAFNKCRILHTMLLVTSSGLPLENFSNAKH